MEPFDIGAEAFINFEGFIEHLRGNSEKEVLKTHNWFVIDALGEIFVSFFFFGGGGNRETFNHTLRPQKSSGISAMIKITQVSRDSEQVSDLFDLVKVALSEMLQKAPVGANNLELMWDLSLGTALEFRGVIYLLGKCKKN